MPDVTVQAVVTSSKLNPVIANLCKESTLSFATTCRRLSGTIGGCLLKRKHIAKSRAVVFTLPAKLTATVSKEGGRRRRYVRAPFLIT